MSMAEIFAGGHLRFTNGAWRDDNGDPVEIAEVVQCKDCKHRGDYGCPMYHEEYIEWDDDGYHESEIVEHDRTRDDGFCDLGERKNND